MKKVYTGPVLVLGRNIDTDQIYPGRFLELVDPGEIGTHCLAGVDEGIAAAFPAGGIIVAGPNFGCGSSREHAPIALLNMGAALIVAESFARIFFRNAINLGLPLVVCKGLREKLVNGDRIAVDLEKGEITRRATGEVFACERPGDYVMSILEAGGVKALFRKGYRP